jgi:hypothetical protein
VRRTRTIAILLVASLLAACGDPAAPPANNQTAAPGSVTAHLDGSATFFAGVASSH